MGKARPGRVHLDPVALACFVVLLDFPLAAAVVAGLARDASAISSVPGPGGRS